jgi:hypothetical protein
MTPRKIFFVGSAFAFALVGALAFVSHALVWLERSRCAAVGACFGG